MDQKMSPWVVHVYLEKTLTRWTRVCLLIYLEKKPDTVMPWTRVCILCGTYPFRKDTDTIDQIVSPNLFKKTHQILWCHGLECVSFCGTYLFRKDTDMMDHSVFPCLFRKDTRQCESMDQCVSLSSAYHLEKILDTVIPWMRVCLLE